MSGIENFNYPLFNEVAKSLRSQGVAVANPAENEEPPGSLHVKRLSYLGHDVDSLRWASEIALLPGWADSPGSFWEACVARWLGLKVSLAHRVGNTWKLESIEWPNRPWTATELGVIL